ncbi:MAG TPA: YciI family protein [Candidatus Dormibacteraeota bacterium]|nr:YciI family protein [Candidatus Dormibacteraeota bacterium]
MKYFFCKLIPPRPTFAQDMTPAERALMGEHVAYWQDLMHKEKALAFGPVADPQGGYGIGIIAASDDAEIDTLRNNDPTIRANQGFRFEALPMPRLMSPLITQ